MTVAQVVDNGQVVACAKTIFNTIGIAVFLKNSVVINLGAGSRFQAYAYVTVTMVRTVVNHVIANDAAAVAAAAETKPYAPVTVDNQVTLHQSIHRVGPEMNAVLGQAATTPEPLNPVVLNNPVVGLMGINTAGITGAVMVPDNVPAAVGQFDQTVCNTAVINKMTSC